MKRVAVAVIGLSFLGMLALVVAYSLGIGDKTVNRVARGLGDAFEADDEPTRSRRPPPPPEYDEPSPRPPLVMPDGGVRFFCDFVDACPLDQFVQYRDKSVVRSGSGQADHAVADGATADNPLCTAPEETRAWERSEPYGLTYRCIPGGNPDAAHQMSVAPNTSGYSFTGSSPNLVFEDVSRISFQVNMTSAGARNFWEVAVIPADQAWIDGMPCIPDVPCNAGYDYDDVDAYGFGNQSGAGSGFQVATPSRPDGHRFDQRDPIPLPDGGVQFRECDRLAYCSATEVHPAQPEVRPRFQVLIEDRADGLWFGQEDDDGIIDWVTVPGEHLPDGPVRVVLKFHGYTPTKSGNGPGFDGNLSASVHAFTWHWDDFEVVAAASVPSADYYGGVNPDRFVTSTLPIGCLAFAQGQREESNRTIWPLISCPEGVDADGAPALVYGSIEQAVE